MGRDQLAITGVRLKRAVTMESRPLMATINTSINWKGRITPVHARPAGSLKYHSLLEGKLPALRKYPKIGTSWLDLPIIGMPTVKSQSSLGVLTMYQFKIEGMTCGGCVGRVTKAIQSVDNSAKVEANVRNRIVRVDSNAHADELQQALTRAGYPSTAAS